LQEARDNAENSYLRQIQGITSVAENDPTTGDGSSLTYVPRVVKSLGPILPNQLAEARRRLLERGELVNEKPKPMFLRKPRW
jgi:hypothetical protein